MNLRTLALLAALPACADDPVYLAGALAIEVGADGMTFTGAASTTLPIRLERPEELARRADLAAGLGVAVPYVKRDDLDLEIEWIARNLDAEEAEIRIQVNGASELFAYAPGAFVVDPEEEEAPPPLMGDVPLLIAGLSDRSGVFREDELAEAALDLELIGRGGLTPFAALLGVDEDRRDFDAAGVTVPSEAWASLIRFDLTLVADRHVVLEYAVRARDHRAPPLLHERLLAAPGGELTTFAPTDLAPAAP